MKKFATILSIFVTSPLLFSASSHAADATVESLATRLSTLENRLNRLENTISEKNNTGSHSYVSSAVEESTNNSKPEVGNTTTYVIQDGDTLGKIATKFGIERAELLKANRLSEGQPIYIGETLAIPSAPKAPVTGTAAKDSTVPMSVSTTTTTTTPTTPTAPLSVTTTPTTPAVPEKTVVNPEKTKSAKQESVVVGETKKSAPATTSTHKVVKGDTLMSLSRKYSTSVESIKAANGLKGDTISLDQTLKIPVANAAASTSQGKAPAKAEQNVSFQYENPLLKPNETYGQYTVVKGDNLYAIARDFLTTMAELQRINNLGSSTVIRPGDEIIVPTSKYNAHHQKSGVAAR